MKINTKIKSLLALAILLISVQGFAHRPDQSYLYFSIYEDSIEGNLQAVAKNLNASVGTNLPQDFTEEELEAAFPQIKPYILDRLQIRDGDTNFDIEFTEFGIIPAGDLGSFGVMKFKLTNVTAIPETITVDYRLFFDEDKKHRGLLLQEYNWKAGIINNETIHSAIFTPKSTTQDLDLSNLAVWTGFWAMVKMGIWHIWIGIDHIFFLIALLLPSVVRRKKGFKVRNFSDALAQWDFVENFKSSFWYILKVVTFFTLAHTITLSLSALGLVKLPSQLVESVIAFSIALAALHNIIPIFKHKEWLIAFIFGLFHGFGFAGVLAEKGMSGEFMAYTLFGFNIGVEIGQVLIILLVFPILFLIRKMKITPYIIILGSVFLIIMSLIWTFERATGINIPFGDPINKLKALFGNG